MPQAEHDIGQQVSLVGLLNIFGEVEIPIIQRDYAQGRRDQRELRREFLSALYKSLSRSGKEEIPPLDLDFVYGSGFSKKSDQSSTFAPLDLSLIHI